VCLIEHTHSIDTSGQFHASAALFPNILLITLFSNTFVVMKSKKLRFGQWLNYKRVKSVVSINNTFPSSLKGQLP
jgi:hypothetical protein